MALTRSATALLLALHAATGAAAVVRAGRAGQRVGVRGGLAAGNSEEAPHYWPHARGQVSHYSSSSHTGPSDFNASLAWSWHHPEGRYSTVVVGAGLIDSEKNIYLASSDGFRKFSPDGRTLWYYRPTGEVTTCPSLMGDALYGNSVDGHIFALSLATGQELWNYQYGPTSSSDASFVESHDGVVIVAVQADRDLGSNRRLLGLAAESGTPIWQFEPDTMFRNVMPLFPGDDTTVFMDTAGGLYRLGLHNGTLLWRTPSPSSDSFGDGGAMLGPDGGLYTCSNAHGSYGSEGQQGALRKYWLSDGRLVWERQLPYPCNSWPAVSAEGSVVVPTGAFNELPMSLDAHKKNKPLEDVQNLHSFSLMMGELERSGLGRKDLPGAIMAFDAQTGEEQWRHEVKPWGRLSAAGDEEGVVERLLNQRRALCMPSHWGAPTLSADGTVYVGRTDGQLYAVSPSKGVETYRTGAGASHPGASFAPGMMAYTDCDSLYVFRAA